MDVAANDIILDQTDKKTSRFHAKIYYSNVVR